MADLRLDDLGAIEFKEFGEETNVFIRKHSPLRPPSIRTSVG